MPPLQGLNRIAQQPQGFGQPVQACYHSTLLITEEQRTVLFRVIERHPPFQVRMGCDQLPEAESWRSQGSVRH
jgi:hypothetical protein